MTITLIIPLRRPLFAKTQYSNRIQFCIMTYISVKPSHVQSNTIYSASGAESLRIARASNNPDSFFTTPKPLFIRMNS